MSGFHGWRKSKYDYCSNTFVKSSSQKPAKIEDEWNFSIGNGFFTLTVFLTVWAVMLGHSVRTLTRMYFYPDKVGQTNTWFTKESDTQQMISRKQSIRHKKNSEIEKSEFEEITPDNTKTCVIM